MPTAFDFAAMVDMLLRIDRADKRIVEVAMARDGWGIPIGGGFTTKGHVPCRVGCVVPSPTPTWRFEQMAGEVLMSMRGNLGAVAAE